MSVTIWVWLWKISLFHVNTKLIKLKIFEIEITSDFKSEVVQPDLLFVLHGYDYETTAFHFHQRATIAQTGQMTNQNIKPTLTLVLRMQDIDFLQPIQISDIYLLPTFRYIHFAVLACQCKVIAAPASEMLVSFNHKTLRSFAKKNPNERVSALSPLWGWATITATRRQSLASTHYDQVRAQVQHFLLRRSDKQGRG